MAASHRHLVHHLHTSPLLLRSAIGDGGVVVIVSAATCSSDAFLGESAALAEIISSVDREGDGRAMGDGGAAVGVSGVCCTREDAIAG